MAPQVQRTGRGGHVGTISTIVSDDADGEVLYDLAQVRRRDGAGARVRERNEKGRE
jgi:hypothetical protein